MLGHKIRAITFLGLAIVCAALSLAFAQTALVSELTSAPLEVDINGTRCALTTYLWRDFMPISPPGGKPLIAKIKVMVVEGQEIPDTIKVTRLWVLKDGQNVWEAQFTGEEQPREFNRFQIEKVAREGPKLEPGIDVDVVVEILDTKTNKRYLLRAARQQINRTD